MEEKIKQLESDIEWLKEMINLVVSFNSQQSEINKSFNQDIKDLFKRTPVL